MEWYNAIIYYVLKGIHGNLNLVAGFLLDMKIGPTKMAPLLNKYHWNEGSYLKVLQGSWTGTMSTEVV